MRVRPKTSGRNKRYAKSEENIIEYLENIKNKANNLHFCMTFDSSGSKFRNTSNQKTFTTDYVLGLIFF